MKEHPARNYVRYLLTTQPALDHPETAYDMVNAKLGLHSIPCPDREYVEQQVERLDVPASYVAGDPLHQESTHFLRRNRIYGMHFQGHDEQQALEILNTPMYREPIECLLLGGYTDEDTAYKINKKLVTLFTKKAIATYRHYFLNTNIMDYDDWCDYLEGFSDAASNPNEPMTYVEKRKAILGGGKASAAYRTGTDMDIDRKDMLGKMLDSLFAAYSEMDQWQISDFKLKHMAKMIRTFDAIYKSLSADNLTDLNEVLRMLKAFSVAGKVHNVKSLAELDGMSREILATSSVQTLPAPAPLALQPGVVFDVEGSPE